MNKDNVKNKYAKASKHANRNVTPNGGEHKHKFKLISLDEENWIGTFACKCGFQKTMKAAFVCR
jgi:hypothetical protein